MPENRSVHRTTTQSAMPLAAPRAAYQGVAGAYGEEAVQRLWGAHARPHPVRTFAEALEALARGDVEWAVVPIWNSTIGVVAPACAALDEHERTIVRVQEVEVPVRHCLLARPGTSFADVRYVGSHPAALAQCARLFRAHRALTPCEAFDTAGAARDLLAFGNPSSRGHPTWHEHLRADSPARLAAIASASAARHYGLVVLRADVNDDPANVTRFVAVRARQGAR
jgi:prephenate dehydratase